MNDPDSLWSFLNEVDGRSIDGLTLPQAEFLVSVIPPSTRYSWLAWRDGLLDWVSLDECKELISGARRLLAKSKTAPDVTRLGDSDPAEEHGTAPDATGTRETTLVDENFKAETSKSQVRKALKARSRETDQRLKRRFKKNFDIEIKWSGGLFRSRTSNISMGGMLLTDPIPAGIGKTFPVILRKKHATPITIFCSATRTPGVTSTGAYRLRIVGVEQEGLLNAWLLSDDDA